MKGNEVFCGPFCTALTGLVNFFATLPHAPTPRNKSSFLGTLVKRGANNRCASGARLVGTHSVKKFNSCDCAARWRLGF
jgi:hypothetical protein